jgi:hypothetical protein
MNADSQQLLNDVLRILHYPLLQLGDSNLTLAGVIKFVCILVLVFAGERLLRRHLMRRVLQRTHFQPSMQFAIGKVVGYVFIALGFYVALKLVGIDLSSLAVVAGAIGVGLGFGLQNVISNFVSGLIILAERPIAIGDRVEMGDVAGLVTKISLRSSTIVTKSPTGATAIRRCASGCRSASPTARTRSACGTCCSRWRESIRWCCATRRRSCSSAASATARSTSSWESGRPGWRQSPDASAAS